jgi:hypothetical protein
MPPLGSKTHEANTRYNISAKCTGTFKSDDFGKGSIYLRNHRQILQIDSFQSSSIRIKEKYLFNFSMGNVKIIKFECVLEQNGLIFPSLNTPALPGGHFSQLATANRFLFKWLNGGTAGYCLLSTQQRNWNSSRLSLGGTKLIKWGWRLDYSNSFPYDTTHKWFG